MRSTLKSINVGLFTDIHSVSMGVGSGCGWGVRVGLGCREPSDARFEASWGLDFSTSTVFRFSRKDQK